MAHLGFGEEKVYAKLRAADIQPVRVIGFAVFIL
jgi:hypothetical protein